MGDFMRDTTSFRFALFFTGLLLLLAIPATAEMFVPLPAKPPIPKDNPMTPAKVELGKKLYFDPRLSLDGTVSCNSCHNVMGSGTDNRPTSAGVKGSLGGRNSPTVWNSAFMTVQFWDGREPSLEAQSKGPLVNSVEMSMADHNMVMGRIRKIPGYVAEFKKAFGGQDPVTIDNLAKAIASYERTLLTPDAPFDLFLKGKKSAINAAAKRGYEKVQAVGCTTCHNGPNYAGPQLPEGTGFYQKFPMFADNPYTKKYALDADPGRASATKNDADRGMWRVPSWRNIAITAPYFHNGTVATLDEAVRVMAKTQLNLDLKEEDVSDIVAFLETLTGKLPKQTMPELPQTIGTTVLVD
jgi:cytochrome c peroxidase